MDEKQKEEAKKAVGWLTGLLTGWGLRESWAKIAAGVLVGAAAGGLSTCQSGCNNVTPEQVQEVHALYHIITGEPCIITAVSK